MSLSIHQTVRYLFGNFGLCTRCLRTAFWATCTASCVALLLFAFGFGQLMQPVLLGAGALFVLWLAHVTIYAFRRSFALTARLGNAPVLRHGGGATPILLVPVDQRAPSRRQVITLFARSAVLAIAASAALPKKARAACGDCGVGWYDCITNFCSTIGQVCCPQGFPYLNHCDCTCYDTTGFNCSSYSNCLYCG